LAERIPDNALVVRGGRNQPDDVRRGTRTHPSGVTGVSVECAAGLPLKDLCKAIPHGQVGVTTVGDIRMARGDVVRTSGRSPFHATVIGLSPEVLCHLLTPTVAKPDRMSEKEERP
jgi:hypothetical protein